MRILGKGHQGIVIAGTPGTVEKFYLSQAQWEQEKVSLNFLAGLRKQGFSINTTIPEMLGAAKGEWSVEGKTYRFRNTMERVHGSAASIGITDQNTEAFGTNLGSLLSSLHTQSKTHVSKWVADFGQADRLLKHLISGSTSKVGKVVEEGSDAAAKEWALNAAQYLGRQLPQLQAQRTLSHPDLNLPNILIDRKGTIQGLVDWGGFGLTNPSLSLYQLATWPHLWGHIQREYEKLGGAIALDIVYAAATVHLAWAPIICKELGQPLDEQETRERLGEVYEEFMACKG